MTRRLFVVAKNDSDGTITFSAREPVRYDRTRADPGSYDGKNPEPSWNPDTDLPSDRIVPARQCRYCGTVNCTKTMCIALDGQDRRNRATPDDAYAETLAASILRDLVRGWTGNQNVAGQFIHSLHAYIDERVEAKLRGRAS